MKNLSLHVHFVMESVPATEFVLGGHCWQVLASGAAAVGENVVAGHSVHALACCIANAPGLHVWQVSLLMAPTVGEAVPAAQATHAVLDVSAYVPVPQTWMTTCSLTLPDMTTAVLRFCDSSA